MYIQGKVKKHRQTLAVLKNQPNYLLNIAILKNRILRDILLNVLFFFIHLSKVIFYVLLLKGNYFAADKDEGLICRVFLESKMILF